MKLEIKDEEDLYNDLRHGDEAPDFFVDNRITWVKVKSLRPRLLVFGDLLRNGDLTLEHIDDLLKELEGEK